MPVWLRRCASFEEEAAADREFWRQFSPDERVALIAELRQDWLTMNGFTPQPPPNDHVEFFHCLNRHGVRALIVGAHAIAFHARPRYTKDIDVFVEASGENAERLIAALTEFGFGTLGLTVTDFATAGQVVQLGQPPNRIDLITSIDGVTFEDAWRTRVPGSLGGEPVSYIGKDELIRNKETAGRPQDLADVALLRSQ